MDLGGHLYCRWTAPHIQRCGLSGRSLPRSLAVVGPHGPMDLRSVAMDPKVQQKWLLVLGGIKRGCWGQEQVTAIRQHAALLTLCSTADSPYIG